MGDNKCLSCQNYARVSIYCEGIFLTYQAMEWQGTAATIVQQRMRHRNQARMIKEQDWGMHQSISLPFQITYIIGNAWI